jgi:hypothetical protein
MLLLHQKLATDVRRGFSCHNSLYTTYLSMYVLHLRSSDKISHVTATDYPSIKPREGGNKASEARKKKLQLTLDSTCMEGLFPCLPAGPQAQAVSVYLQVHDCSY